MALTLEELIELTKDQFSLNVIAGTQHFGHVVTWVHMMEDTDITRLFWGNEVVVTTGYTLKTEEDMFHLIDTLDKARCTALIINTGKYIKKVPKSVIDYCEKMQLPLLTIPWKVHVTEFVRECCSLVNYSSQDERFLADTILHIVHNPQDIDSKREYLNQYFQEENGFQMIAVKPDRIKPLGNIADQRRILRIHSTMQHYTFPYVLLGSERSFLILINLDDPDITVEISEKIIRVVKKIYAGSNVNIGISDIKYSYEHLRDCYHGSISASRRASLQKLPYIRFSDMGFYKLLYSVPDESLLIDYYHEVMDPLLTHDPDNADMYAETLFRYLLCDGHLKDVAEQMFVHRNTVNYRMGKIREIIGCDLNSQAERLPFQIAYHIAVILKIVKELN